MQLNLMNKHRKSQKQNEMKLPRRIILHRLAKDIAENTASFLSQFLSMISRKELSTDEPSYQIINIIIIIITRRQRRQEVRQLRRPRSPPLSEDEVAKSICEPSSIWDSILWSLGRGRIAALLHPGSVDVLLAVVNADSMRHRRGGGSSPWL